KIDAAIVATRSIGESGVALAGEMREAIGRVLILTDDTNAGAGIDPRHVLAETVGKKQLLEGLALVIAAKRAAGDDPAPLALRFDGRTIDVAGRAFFDAGGCEIPLTRAEFALLLTFAQRPGRVLSREQLRSAVAGRTADPFDRSIDMLVGRL